MRSLLSKITAIAAVAFMMLGLLAVPSAEAQPTYPPGAPGGVDCDSLPAPSISIAGNNIRVSFAQGSLTCIVRVVVEVNPVIYDGPVPAGGSLLLPIPALVGDDFTATVTATYSIGIQKSDSVAISPAALERARNAAARANGNAGNAANNAGGAPAAAPLALPAAGQNLAFTGSDVNAPLAAGALLIGAGGLVLLAARKREQNA